MDFTSTSLLTSHTDPPLPKVRRAWGGAPSRICVFRVDMCWVEEDPVLKYLAIATPLPFHTHTHTHTHRPSVSFCSQHIDFKQTVEINNLDVMCVTRVKRGRTSSHSYAGNHSVGICFSSVPTLACFAPCPIPKVCVCRVCAGVTTCVVAMLCHPCLALSLSCCLLCDGAHPGDLTRGQPW